MTTGAGTVRETPPGARSRWLALGVLAAGVSMIVIDGTIMGVALPVIIDELGLRLQDGQWVNSVFGGQRAGRHLGRRDSWPATAPVSAVPVVGAVGFRRVRHVGTSQGNRTAVGDPRPGSVLDTHVRLGQRHGDDGGHRQFGLFFVLPLFLVNVGVLDTLRVGLVFARWESAPSCRARRRGTLRPASARRWSSSRACCWSWSA